MMRLFTAAMIGLTLCLPVGAQDSTAPDPLPADTVALFESVRSSAIARRRAVTKRSKSPLIRKLRAIRVQRSTSTKAWAKLARHSDGTRTQWISSGLLDQLAARAGRRPHFERRVLALILARQLAALWTISPVDQAETEAVRVFNRLALPGGTLREDEIRAAVELLTESRGLEVELRLAFPSLGALTFKVVALRRVAARYGSIALQIRKYKAAVTALSAAKARHGMSAALSH